MVSAIIVAAGSSRRMGFDKLFAKLAGKPVLWHSIKAFLDTPEIEEVLVVTKGDHVAHVEQLFAKEKLKKPFKVVEGGEERHDSVWLGLQAVSSKGSEFVAIHDGARPLVTPELIAK